MQNIKVIQHYRLEHPFTGQMLETYEQAVMLGRGEISPHIDNTIFTELRDNWCSENTFEPQVIIASPVTRAIETAQAIQTTCFPNIKILQNDNIKEITWDLSSFLSKEEYELAQPTHKFDIGNKRIEAFIEGTSLTNLSEVLERMHKFEADILELPFNNILVVTHSFVMNIIHTYFVKQLKDKDHITIESIQNSPKISYLHGFEFQLFN